MILLAIDSTALTGSVAIIKEEKPLCRFSVNNGNKHSEILLPMIRFGLEVSGLSVDDVDVFALSAGPGSFTGVRIGCATIKGLAFGTGKPCVAVSTLEALAYHLIGHDGILCPVMNARRNQVYNALFRSRGGVLERLTEDRALAIPELEEELKRYEEPVWLSGDGYDITLQNFREFQPRQTPISEREQDAYAVARIALEKYRRGEFCDDKTLVPVYLRLSQAERERLVRENPGGIKM